MPVIASIIIGAAQQAVVQVLKQGGDNLTRENVMQQAASLKDFPTTCCCWGSGSTPTRTGAQAAAWLDLTRE
jgi:hypothetical protein